LIKFGSRVRYSHFYKLGETADAASLAQKLQTQYAQHFKRNMRNTSKARPA